MSRMVYMKSIIAFVLSYNSKYSSLCSKKDLTINCDLTVYLYLGLDLISTERNVEQTGCLMLPRMLHVSFFYCFCRSDLSLLYLLLVTKLEVGSQYQVAAASEGLKIKIKKADGNVSDNIESIMFCNSFRSVR